MKCDVKSIIQELEQDYTIKFTPDCAGVSAGTGSQVSRLPGLAEAGTD